MIIKYHQLTVPIMSTKLFRLETRLSSTCRISSDWLRTEAFSANDDSKCDSERPSSLANFMIYSGREASDTSN